MTKIFGLALWVLFFVIAFRFVYVNVIKDMLEKERNNDESQTEK